MGCIHSLFLIVAMLGSWPLSTTASHWRAEDAFCPCTWALLTSVPWLLQVAQHNKPDDCWVSFLGRVYNITDVVQVHLHRVSCPEALGVAVSRDLSRPLSQANAGPLTEPLVRVAGQDISHWFDPSTEDIRTWSHPKMGCVLYYTPMGRFVHIPPEDPSSNENTVSKQWMERGLHDTLPPTSVGPALPAQMVSMPWWKDLRYKVGALSLRTRQIRFKNVLTQQEHLVEARVAGTRAPGPGPRGCLLPPRADARIDPPPQVPSEETVEEIRARYLPFNWHAAR